MHLYDCNHLVKYCCFGCDYQNYESVFWHKENILSASLNTLTYTHVLFMVPIHIQVKFEWFLTWKQKVTDEWMHFSVTQTWTLKDITDTVNDVCMVRQCNVLHNATIIVMWLLLCYQMGYNYILMYGTKSRTNSACMYRTNQSSSLHRCLYRHQWAFGVWKSPRFWVLHNWT